MDPRLSFDRDRAALAQGDGHRRPRPQRDPLLGDVGEEVVGLVDVAGQPVRNREQHHGARSQPAPTGKGRDRELRICAHPRDPSPTMLRTHEGAATRRSKRCRRKACRRSSRVRRHRHNAPPPPAGPRARRSVRRSQRPPRSSRLPRARPASRASVRRSRHGHCCTCRDNSARYSRAVRSTSSAACAYPIAASGCPFASHQSAARASSCGTRSGSTRPSSARSSSWKRWW